MIARIVVAVGALAAVATTMGSSAGGAAEEAWWLNSWTYWLRWRGGW